VETKRWGEYTMKAVTLLYHDVIEPGRAASSGFNSSDADIYKLDTGDFERHLQAIAGTRNAPETTVWELLKSAPISSKVPVFLSFDDGGASAPATADMLDRRGWKGHFFITTDFIGTPAFMTAADIRELCVRGHVVGSHSCSHPRRISYLSDNELQMEWRNSVASLQEILGEKVEAASVPGGFYSNRVGEFASRAGIRALFNSEPTVRISQINNCAVIGRFGLQRDSSAELAAQFARRDPSTLLRQAAYWNAKKLVKAAGGEHWLAFRKWWLAQ
jgi:peptidoglycan/xylan/chitin deacetylase (PgdA/CDA1 family)